jgi:hypothetical protein
MILVGRGIEESQAQAVVGACIAAIVAVYNLSQGWIDKEKVKNGGSQ